MRFLLLLLFICFGLQAANPPAEFRTHTIEPEFPGGYALILLDVNKDGRLDVVGVSGRITELAWYENPSWERHVINDTLRRIVNLAPHDVDGDGIPEIALQSEFSMRAAQSEGLVWVLEHQGDPREPWKVNRVDALTTSHHVAWADVDGDGRMELINSPLIGAEAVAPKYEGMTELLYYPVPQSLEGPWVRKNIDHLSGVVHRVRVVKWVPGEREQLLTTSFEGVKLHQPHGEGEDVGWDNTVLVPGHAAPAPRAGASDVKVGNLNGKRFVATVEPWHGNNVVAYLEEGYGSWRRHILFEELTEGHEICVGDFNGDGLDDIVAGDRARGKVASSHLFFAQDDTATQWHHEVLDHLGMSASGCAVGDMNRDGRLDIVMIGGATHNIKWYENLGVSAGATQ